MFTLTVLTFLYFYDYSCDILFIYHYFLLTLEIDYLVTSDTFWLNFDL